MGLEMKYRDIDEKFFQIKNLITEIGEGVSDNNVTFKNLKNRIFSIEEEVINDNRIVGEDEQEFIFSQLEIIYSNLVKVAKGNGFNDFDLQFEILHSDINSALTVIYNYLEVTIKEK